MFQNLIKKLNQQESQELPLTRSPNLIYNDLKRNPIEPLIEKRHIQIATAAKLSIIIAQLAFGVLIAYNSRIASSISAQEKEVKKLEIELIGKKSQSEEVQEVIKKIEKLKGLQLSTPRLTQSVTKVINTAPKPQQITRVHIQPSTMSLEILTDNPLEVSELINAYFRNALTNEITIRSSSLSTATQKYTTVLEIKFK
jgi:hypothetical protein